MSTKFTLADVGATNIIHIIDGIPRLVVTTGTDNTLLCSSVFIDSQSQVVGVIDATHTTESAAFTVSPSVGDRIVFPSASPPTIVPG